ncbi:hypothetical protein PR202_ga00333 [Eleusine coracana subsp. coracana]|uniref:Uncharacterized protein n=1 Tax=Eleusine coracana subsp. coracana TaxID=191504 RepID=A0AAV5BC33_ELECO|nr:hypothetical protein PR202_ga00333 [Eleusine coracana subsp. coracana]
MTIGGDHNHKVSGIIGILCRRHYPGLVVHGPVTEPANTWDDYIACPDARDLEGRIFNNKAERVVNELWAIVDYNAQYLKMMIKKEQARTMNLTREQYLQWEEQHNACREHRLMMQGAPHHQGSLTLSDYASRWSDSHGGQACGQFKAWAMAHKGKAMSDVNYNPEDSLEAYSNASIHSRLSDYTSMAREVHGPEYDPSVENLDAEIVMRVGGGKKHGRYWICDSTIDTANTPSLSQIRARSTSSSPAIRSRPTTTHAQMETLRLKFRSVLKVWPNSYHAGATFKN